MSVDLDLCEPGDAAVVQHDDTGGIFIEKQGGISPLYIFLFPTGRKGFYQNGEAASCSYIRKNIIKIIKKAKPMTEPDRTVFGAAMVGSEPVPVVKVIKKSNLGVIVVENLKVDGWFPSVSEQNAVKDAIDAALVGAHYDAQTGNFAWGDK